MSGMPALPGSARPRGAFRFAGPHAAISSSPAPTPNSILTLLLGAAAVGLSPAVLADDAAVESLLKKSNCLKCHAVDKKKEGPSFRDTAAKYRGKADAEAKLVSFLTTSPKVKIDGRDESHDSLKTRNDADVRDVVRWILSR